MKARLIVAAIGLPLLILMLLFLPVAVTAGAVSVICVFAVYELLWATGLLRSIRIVAVSAAMTIFTCVWSYLGMPGLPMQIALFLFLCYLFWELLCAEDRAEFHAHLPGPVCGNRDPLSSLGRLRRILSMEEGRYLVYAPFVMTMVPDSGAFLVGRKVGKHKLAPAIQPKQKR